MARIAPTGMTGGAVQLAKHPRIAIASRHAARAGTGVAFLHYTRSCGFFSNALCDAYRRPAPLAHG